MITANNTCTKLTRKLYVQICYDVEEGNYTKTWCWQIKKLLYQLNLERLWENEKDKGNINYNNFISIRLFQRVVDKKHRK